MKQTFTLSILLLVVSLSFGKSNTQRSFKNIFRKEKQHFKAFARLGSNAKVHSLKSTQAFSQKLNYSIEEGKYLDNDWEVYTRSDYYYNDDNQVSEVIEYRELEDGEKDYEYKYTYTYDNNKMYYLEFWWDNETNGWSTSAYYREEYTYDTEGKLNNYLGKYRENGAWLDDYRITYNYNANGYLISEVYEYYEYDANLEQGEWLVDESLDIARDADGKITSITAEMIEDDSDEYVTLTTKAEGGVTYNANGDLIQLIIGFTDNGVWVNTQKLAMEYDDNGNCLSDMSYSYGDTDWEEEIDEGTEFTYYLNYDFSEVMGIPKSMYYDSFYFKMNNIMHTDTEYWNDDDDTYGIDRTTYYYSDIVSTGVENIESADIILYPNPVESNLQVSFSSNSNAAGLKLYNISGELIFSKEVADEELINIEALSSGIYIYKITVDGDSKNGKLIKK